MELLEKIKKDLKILTAWFWNHKLYPSLSKTKLISYNFQNLDLHKTLKLHLKPSCQKTCDCAYLAQVTEIQYLGLILDQKMSWESHTTHLQNKLRKLNYLMYYTSRSLTRKHLLRVYKALYEPVFRYGIIHWGHAPKKYTTPIKILQKYCIRIIVGLKKCELTAKWFHDLGILNFDQTYKLFSAKYAHRHFDTIGLNHSTFLGLRDRGTTLFKPK